MDRREFFRRGLRKTGEAVVKKADSIAKAQSIQWIRPPYALNELEFLLLCTRCGKCTEACPHEVVFPLPSKYGPQVAGTPALDLLQKGCHLCEDWPCVHACEPGALKLPETSEEEVPPLPRLARAEINTATCLPYNGPECGVCVDHCPVPGTMILEGEKPHIARSLCVGCGMCREVCVTDPKSISIRVLIDEAD
jgi:ferredoxin-type protein NapG